MIGVRLQALKPGMILAKPVYNPQEVLLLSKGAEVTEKGIWVLKTWGVTRVWVEGEGEAEKERLTESQKKANETALKALEKRFSDVKEDPVMMEIMRVAGKRLAEG